MKLMIQKNELNDAIQQVSKAASTRPAIPILGGIKFEVAHQGLTLTASDTDISIQSFVPVESGERINARIDKPGSVVLPAKFIVEIIKKLPSDEIEIEVGEHFQTRLRSGSSDIQMVGLDPEEFPVLPQMDEHESFAIQGALLKTLIRQTAFAVSTSEQTPVLTGVLWNLQEGRFKFVATDRHRLASRVANVETAPEYRFANVVVAGRTLQEVSRLVPDQGEPVEIVVTDNQILFKIGRVLFYSRLLDGTYPDTSKIIPQQYKTELVLDTRRLTDAIDRAYLMSREEKTNIVRLITLEDGTIEISSSSSELGKVTEQLDAVRIAGEPLRISFNSKYMLDTLKAIDSEQLFIGFNGAMSPIIVKPTEHDHSLHLVLPYRTTG
ncbi:DNA polymerase III subunit beta [Paenibacillus sp. IB182496]|uniref:Beta sliding clamp n=1 Tax=Paenibacillus sabuli TaxID=2772509 RepID=A0A927GUC7_9BACL|nr:DNA polymerase III subunit beta [Paenibacillus sabuli]MBD2848025.1 DNA polymerase III subunit beta [Paenibacillus sabuli]